MQLVILIGPPGSGKSTLATTKYKDYVRVSQDDQGKVGHMQIFRESLSVRADIVIDRMNFNTKQRTAYAEVAKGMGYEILYHMLFVPKDVCMQRMLDRKDHPTIKTAEDAQSALDMFFRFFEYPVLTGTTERIKYDYHYIGYEHMCPTAVICDLDGTLCNIDHRLHHVRNENRKERRWDKFFAEIPNDTVNREVALILSSMYDTAATDALVYVSGRGEQTRKDTEEWLQYHALDFHQHLFMRPAKDSRDDSLIKEIILDFELLPRYDILFVLDDRDRVVQAWRRRGIRCLQVAEGDF